MNFPEYPKIETLFERDERTFVVDPTRLRSPVLGTIREWDVTEKIDGMNVRVGLSEAGMVQFGGRTAAAQMPMDLLQYLIETFPEEKLRPLLWRDGPVDVVLYGEGYGPGIQKGGGSYRKDKAFVLFDVLVGGRWWLDGLAVKNVALNLGIGSTPYLGRMDLESIVTLVQEQFPSQIGTAAAEGVVLRPIEPLYDRRLRRVIAKLKTRDFAPGKR